MDNGHLLVEKGDNGTRAYKSLVVEPQKMGVLNSRLALDIVRELARQPCCALDIARSLQEDEQKVYYYLKKLEASGIVKLNRLERRHGMTAKIYEVLAPVISAKLHDNEHVMQEHETIHDPKMLDFLSPFVKNGKLNAVIVIGDPYSHGRFDKESHEGPYAFDLAVFLGKFISDLKFPHYKLDTEITEEDLKKNLILIGNMKSNVVVDMMNEHLPIYFDIENDFRVISKFTGNSYRDPRIGVIMKFDNPLSKGGSKVLIIGGIGSRGSRSSVIAFTEHFEDLVKNQENGNVFRVVKGFDRSGDRIIDDVEILE